MEKSKFTFTCVLIKEGVEYTSLCIDLDIASQGTSIDEAKKNLREAVGLYVESAIESNLPIIRPVPLSENPLKTRPEDIVEIFEMNIAVQVNVYV